MANVYKVRHMHLDQVVALKLLRRDMCNDERKVRRFKQEAKAASGLHHPNLINVQGFGICDGTPYLIMDYVEGDGLDAILEAEGVMPLARVLDVGIQVASALGYLHQHRIIHRDVKPANIIATTDGAYKVVDFGVVKLEQDENDAGIDRQSQSLTQTGTLIGTPAYMSPEQSTAGSIDGRSDIYSLGCLLFELITGKPPYEAETHYTMLAQHLKGEIPSLSDTLVKPECEALNTVLQKCLAKSPDDRYQSMQELIDALVACDVKDAPVNPGKNKQSKPPSSLSPRDSRATRRGDNEISCTGFPVTPKVALNAVLGAIALMLLISIPVLLSIPEKKSQDADLEYENTESLKRMALDDLSKRDHAKAIVHLRQALFLLRKNGSSGLAQATVQEQLALVLKDTGDPVSALPLFLEVEKVYSRAGSTKAKDNRAVIFNIGVCLQRLGRFKEAAYWMEKSVKAGSTGADIAYPLGETLFSLGRYEEVGGVPYPWESKLPADRLTGYSWHGKRWGALPNFTKAERYGLPQHRPYLADSIAATLVKLRRYDEAEQWAHRIPQQAPELAWLRDHRLARIKLARKDVKTAKMMIEALLRDEKQMRDPRIRVAQEADLATIWYREKNYVQAEQHFNNAYKLLVQLLHDQPDPLAVKTNFDNLLWVKRGLDLSRQKLRANTGAR